MSLNKLTAIGFVSLFTNTPISQQQSFSLTPSTIQLTKATTVDTIRGYKNGGGGTGFVPLETFEQPAEYTGQLVFTSLNADALQIAFNEFWSTTTSYEYKLPLTGTVPTAPGPYTISNTAFNGAGLDDVQVSIVERTGAVLVGGLQVVTTTVTPSTSQVALNPSTTGGSLTFASGLAGVAVNILVNSTLSNKRSLLVESSAQAIDSLSFTGIATIGSEEFLIDAPRLKIAASWDFAFTGEAGEISVPLTPTIFGVNRDVLKVVQYS